MSTGTCVLFGAHSDELSRTLEELEMDLVMAASPAAAQQLFDVTPAVSLLVIDGCVGREAGTELLLAAKAAHPGLPVLWIARRELVTPLESEHVPDRLINAPIAEDQLRVHIEGLTARALYSDVLRRALDERVGAVLSDAFGMDIAARELGIRANAGRLGDVSTVLPFCGPTLAGTLLVSGEATCFAAAHTHVLGPSSRELVRADLEDIAGEIGNLVLSRIKAYFEQLYVSLEIGVPVQLRGPDALRRVRSRHPALALSFGQALDRLHVVFGFDTVDPETNRSLAAVPPREKIASGVVCFL